MRLLLNVSGMADRSRCPGVNGKLLFEFNGPVNTVSLSSRTIKPVDVTQAGALRGKRELSVWTE